MPDMHGILSTEEINQIIHRLQELDRQRGAAMTCAVCTHKKWTIQPRTLALQGSAGIAGLLGLNSTQNFVLVTCNNCSQSLIFEASAMGVRPPVIPMNAFAPKNEFGGPNG